MLEVQCHAGFALLGLEHPYVELEMQLEDSASWFFVHGQIVRVRPDTQTIVIAMESLADPLAAVLDRSDAREIDDADERRVEVLIVDDELDRRMHIAAAFRAEGCRVSVASSHGAITSLSDRIRAAEIIVVASADDDELARSLRAFVDTTYTNARVVSVGGPEWTPSRPRIDATDSEDLLRARIRSLLHELRV